ncbi:MAG: hypothetical protein HXX18_01560 [Bacteroidetes bacterium]|nr:hypothetical protein [Bacteroidota bacterium]
MGNIIKIIGISRGEIFSPNHTNNDGMIFQQTVNELSALGATVEIMDEKAFQKTEVKTNILFSMARDPKSINKLIELEKNGALVINSGNAINNCYRANLTKILLDNYISYPKSIIVKTNDVVWEELNVFENYPVWIKRGDVHAIHKEDVVLVYSLGEANNVLSEFHKRGIVEAVIMEHVYGDIIKFYGVRESGYFHWFNLLDTNHSKFNIEKDVNSNNHTFFNINDLRELAESAARLAGVYIYGGDVIVQKDGSLCLIDLNDWPSFAPIRDIASNNIARMIYNQAVKFVKEGTKPFVFQNQLV